MRLFFIILIILSVVIAKTSDVQTKAPKPVDYLDAKSFSGLWYEIARTENSFQRNCELATVQYNLKKDLHYEVINRCVDKKSEKKIIEYNGTAKASNGNIMSQIDMTYFWIFTKQYRIIYLTKDYTSAIMVDNDMEYVWIINRKPNIEKKTLDNMVSFLSDYMDTDKLIYTPEDLKGNIN